MSAYYNEHDPHAAEWLRNLIKQGHVAPGEVDERSIEDVCPIELSGFSQCHFFAGIGVWSYALRRAGWPDDRPVWTGSCPCQPFSAAGKGAGSTDERHLWPAWHHLVSQCRPPVVFGEQVASPLGLGWLDLVQSDMEAAGYAFGAFDLCAAGVGAPHIRQRLYFVADADHERRYGLDALLREETRGRLEAGVPEITGRGGSLVVEHPAGNGRDERRPEPGGRGSERGCGAGDWQRVMFASECDPNGDGILFGRPPVDTFGPRLEGHRGYGDNSEKPRRITAHEAGSIGAAGATRGFWADADWLWCRDKKFRPAQPGVEPLVDGAAFRLGSGSAFEGKSRQALLKGYGNAIVAPLAQTFIEEAMKCFDA